MTIWDVLDLWVAELEAERYGYPEAATRARTAAQVRHRLAGALLAETRRGSSSQRDRDRGMGVAGR